MKKKETGWAINILTESTCARESAKEKFGDWRSEESHRVLGFEVLDHEDEYCDMNISFKPERNKDYFLLFVEYSTGDSFGRATGKISYIGLYESEEIANENAKRISEHYKRYQERKDYSDEFFSIELQEEGGLTLKYSTSCWIGYFESLDDVVVQAVSWKGKRSFL